VTVVFAARQIHSPGWGVQVRCQAVASTAFATTLTPRAWLHAQHGSSDIGVFATARMRSNCGIIITSTLSSLSWGDVGVDTLDALSCPVNEPPVRVARR
jgi:hypothetical protein